MYTLFQSLFPSLASPTVPVVPPPPPPTTTTRNCADLNYEALLRVFGYQFADLPVKGIDIVVGRTYNVVGHNDYKSPRYEIGSVVHYADRPKTSHCWLTEYEFEEPQRRHANYHMDNKSATTISKALMMVNRRFGTTWVPQYSCPVLRISSRGMVVSHRPWMINALRQSLFSTPYWESLVIATCLGVWVKPRSQMVSNHIPPMNCVEKNLPMEL